MKGICIHRIVPAVLMAAATAIPVATTVEILAHVPAEPNAGASSTTGGSSQASAAPTATSPATATPASATSNAPAPSTATAPAATATAAPPAATPTTATRTYAGPVEYNRYGAVQATITVSGGKNTAVTISAPEDNPRSADINEQAIPILQSETLQAQSANVDIVSGATYTSESYLQSLQAALAEAHIS